jgi:hypothetical protein
MRQHAETGPGQRRAGVLKMWLLTGLILAVLSPNWAFASGGDNFDNNSRDPAKWGVDEVKGHGRLNETNGRLEYTCGTGTALDSSDRPWIIERFPYDADWEIWVDATNNTSPSGDQYSSFGINVRSANYQGNEIEIELEAYGSGFRGFLAEFHFGGIPFGYAEQGAATQSAPIRLSFNATTKVFTVSYYADPGTGYQWVDFGSFGVNGSGGANGNALWGLTDSDQFVAYVFGYSEKMTVGDGQLYGDNFVETGGVAPAITAPGPTGSFKFGFPLNNPLLTAILNITGNYKGSDSWFKLQKRNYAMDVAQDESGKLSGMGTMDGVKNTSGPPDISGAGAITTVNGKPTVQVKGSFSGTFDGVAATASTTLRGPVDVTDLGGGTAGFAGTGSLKGKLGGVPFNGTRDEFDAPEGTSGNLKKQWSLRLDIAGRQDSKGKTYLVASSQLLLPNGDTIVFPEKRTKYSAQAGYSLSFKGGTNVTVTPQKVDKKTSILIRGMTLAKKGNAWETTAGTITYSFLGQKGTGNLVDFIVP